MRNFKELPKGTLKDPLKEPLRPLTGAPVGNFMGTKTTRALISEALEPNLNSTHCMFASMYIYMYMYIQISLDMHTYCHRQLR